MATPPLTQLSAPPSPSPAGTSTSIPIADGGIPSLPPTTTEQQESDATAGSTVIQVESEQQARQTTGRTRYLKGPIALEYCLMCLFGTCYVLFKILSPCLKWAWNCVEFWTPISATFLVYWLIYRPDHFHPHTGSAVLAAFDLTDATTLQYDLAVDLSFRNSHHLAIRYLDVAASVFYNGTRLGPTDDPLPRFIQRRKTTTVLHPAFHGAVTVESGVAAELQRERTAGTVHLRITVSLTLVYKVLFVKDVFFYEYDCWLWFPPPRNHTPALFDGDGTMCCGARDVYENDESFIFKVVYFVFKMVFGYMATSLSMLLLYGIYFRPYAVRPNVDAAALAAFDLAPGPGDNTMLRYDLALNVTFFNDHRIWAIRFNHFTARLYFNGTQVSPPDDTFPKFKGRLRRHRTVHPVLRGRASNVSAAVAEDFSCQRAQGWFTVQVKLRATLTYVIWPTWYVYYYEYDCWLHFPSNAMPAVIGGVKCSKGKQFALS